MKRRIASRGSLAAAAIALLLPGNGIAPGEEPQKGETFAPITVTSAAFSQGGSIPAKYTCDGSDMPPPLKWAGAPAGTKSFALICDDPDAPAGTWVHWVLFNLRAPATELGEKLERVATLPGGASQGTNSFMKIGYGGPCPPPGKPHRYFFKLYALDTEIPLKPGATKQELLRAMEKHILAQGQLMGTYQRKKQ
jgi:Raf kinase inhibitor-like YbhB/YbcL family protein